MKHCVLTYLLILLWFNFFGQEKKQYKICTIAFYNLENAFDTINDPNTYDEYSPILQTKQSKSEVYWNKLNNLATVLTQIGSNKNSQAPSVIGVCEVETSRVLDDLITTKPFKDLIFDYVHIESEDWRGSDVALLYNPQHFQPTNYKGHQLWAFSYEGYRVKTRNILRIDGYLQDEPISFIVVHWPSQRSGTEKTKHLRIAAAELTKKVVQEIKAEIPNQKIVVMGDFNLDPQTDYFNEILSIDSNKKTKETDLINPFIKLYKKGHGSIGFRDNLHLYDQILISKSLANKNFETFGFYEAGIYNPSFLINKKGRYKGYPFRSWGTNNQFTNGYSDHYPVYIYLLKELD